MVGDERERGAPARRAVDARVRRDADEARERRVVADVARDHVQAEPRRRLCARDRGLGRVVRLGHLARRVGGRRGGMQRTPSACTRSRHWSKATGFERSVLHLGDLDRAPREQAVDDRQRHLGDDRQRRLVEQVVRLGDRAVERVLDRQHAERDLGRDRGLDDGDEARVRLGRRAVAARARSDAAALWLPAGPGIADDRGHSATAAAQARHERRRRTRSSSPCRRRPASASTRRAASTAASSRRASSGSPRPCSSASASERSIAAGFARAGARDVGRRAVHRLEDAGPPSPRLAERGEAEPAGHRRRRRRRGCRRRCSPSRARRSSRAR